MDENNTHVKPVSVKDYWDALSTKQKVAVVGTAAVVGYTVLYVRRLRKEVDNLNAVVAYVLKDQGYIPIKK